MLKSKFLKSIFIILAVLMIGAFGYALRRVNTNTGNKKITKSNDLEQEVRDLIPKVAMVNNIRSDGKVVSFDYGPSLNDPNREPWWVAEDKLVNLGERAVPILIEIAGEDKIAENKSRSNRAIYILGRIGCEDSKNFLISTLLDQEENIITRVYTVQALGDINIRKNDDDPKILEALKHTALDKNEDSVVRKWSQGVLESIKSKK